MYLNDACFSICISKIWRIRLICIPKGDQGLFPLLRGITSGITWNQCYAQDFSGPWKTWWLACVGLARCIAVEAEDGACSCLAERSVFWQGQGYALVCHRISLIFLELVTRRYDMIHIISWQMLRSDLSVSLMKTCICHEFKRSWGTPSNALRIAMKIKLCGTHKSPCDISLRFLSDLYLLI